MDALGSIEGDRRGELLAGRYMLGERIGDGGMGVVYKAHHARLDRPLAVKVLPPGFDDDALATRRLRDEGRAARRVRHPNIVRIVELGEDPRAEPFLVMEHIAGESLRRIVGRDGRLAVPRALALVTQLLDALGEAHRCGVTHADVASDNVLVTPSRDGREVATLIDFGLARVAEYPYLRAGEPAAGTPAYVAPELVRGEAPTASSDLYSAAVVLYELLTGLLPFGDDNPLVVLYRHVTDPVVAPSCCCAPGTIPPELDAVVLRALAKDPAERYATAGELARAALASA